MQVLNIRVLSNAQARQALGFLQEIGVTHLDGTELDKHSVLDTSDLSQEQQASIVRYQQTNELPITFFMEED